MSREDIIKENKEINKVRKKAEKELMKIPGVVAVGVGMKETKGKLEEELCFKVKVKEKKPLSEIKDKDKIPEIIYGFKTDVTEIVHGEACADEEKYRPLMGGIQIGCSKSGGYGTMGCFGKRDVDDKIVLLSNWHVIVSGGSAIEGERVGQPSHNGCCSCCACGEIADVVDGRLSPNTADNLDAAIALLQGQETDTIPEARFINEVKQLGIIAGSASPEPREKVWNYGRTTGFTSGRLSDDADFITITYEQYGNVSHTFLAWEITPDADYDTFVDKGDSGSICINEHNEVVLLIFAKDDTGKGYGFDIKDVESKLHFKVLDSTFHKSDPLSEGTPLSSITLPPPRLNGFADTFELLEEELNQFEEPRQFVEMFKIHRKEILHLVNHNREVMAAWNRYQGPSFLAHIARSLKRENKPIPGQIKGVTLQNLLLKMTAVLQRKGSPELVKAVTDNYLKIMDLVSSGHHPDDWKAYLAKINQPININ